MIGASQSFNMKPATAHVPPCMGKENRAPQVAIVKSKGLSVEQRKALELLEEKCPVAQRDDGYDTVY